MTEHFFRDNPLSEFLSSRISEMRKDVKGTTPQEINNSSKNEWIGSLFSKYELEPVKIHSDTIAFLNPKISECKDCTWVSPYENPEYTSYPSYLVSCVVEFSGNYELLYCIPPTTSFEDLEADKMVKPTDAKPGYLYFSANIKLGTAEADTIKDIFAGTITRFEEEMKSMNERIENFNSSLSEIITNAVNEKLSENEKFNELNKALNIPLNKVKDAPIPITIPKIKRKLSINQPKQSNINAPEYKLSDENYEHIIEVIDRCCACWETSPDVYSQLDEESLRQIILGLLNSHYEYATAETFRNQGKTDIYIPFEGHVAYIAECKIWSGSKKLQAAIDQLFSYATWRDTQVSIILFNKKTSNYKKVLSSIAKSLSERADTVTQKKQDQWLCKIKNSIDDRIMTVTVQSFNLYCKGDGQ